MIPPERKRVILLLALAELRCKVSALLLGNIDSGTRQKASAYKSEIQELEREVRDGR